jgi:FixJ family two-component response regulator
LPATHTFRRKRLYTFISPPSCQNGPSSTVRLSASTVSREPLGIFALSKVQVVSIIDDDASVRAGIESLVMSIGFAARVFESAEAFLHSSQVEGTSCLITDVQMPGMSGLELQSQLISQGVHLPIILITGFPEQSARERALGAGALAYLEKPFDGGAVAKLLREVLGDPSA